MLTRHQQFHLDAVERDAADIVDIVKRQRVLAEADDFLTNHIAWPVSIWGGDIPEAGIHDYIEKGDRSG